MRPPPTAKLLWLSLHQEARGQGQQDNGGKTAMPILKKFAGITNDDDLPVAFKNEAVALIRSQETPFQGSCRQRSDQVHALAGRQ